MTPMPRFNYDLQELNEWVLRDCMKAQYRLGRIATSADDLQEIGEWGARDQDDSRHSIGGVPMGLPALLGVTVGLVGGGFLLFVLCRMVFAFIGL